MIGTIINENGELKPVHIVLAFIIIYVLFLTVVVIIRPNFFIYFAILVPFLPVLLFILINKLDYALLIYIVILPIIQHYSNVSILLGDFRISPDMIIHLILLIASVNYFLYSYNSYTKRSLSLQDKILLVFVLFTVFSLIAASYFPINHSKRILLYYTGIFQPISFYFIILYFLSRVPNFINKLVLAILLTASSASIIAFIELREVGLSLINIFLTRNQIGFGYRNTNLFGMHAALVFPLYFYALKSDEFNKQKYLLWLNFILLSILSVLTLNRGTFVVLIVYLFLLFWKKENRKIVIGFIFAGIMGAIYYIDLLILYINRFFGGGGGQSKFLADHSALYRLEIWRVAVEAIVNYPLGMGGVGFGYAWKKFSIDPTRIFHTPHQLVLYVAIDYGIPALLVFICLFIIVFKRISLLSRVDSLSQSKLLYYIKLALIGYLIHGFLTGGEFSHLSGNMLPNNGYSYILMILLAIVSFQYGKYRDLKT
ncbi:O-antigen ligase family protein [Bacteroidota bacterium]